MRPTASGSVSLRLGRPDGGGGAAELGTFKLGAATDGRDALCSGRVDSHNAKSRLVFVRASWTLAGGAEVAILGLPAAFAPSMGRVVAAAPAMRLDPREPAFWVFFAAGWAAEVVLSRGAVRRRSVLQTGLTAVNAAQGPEALGMRGIVDTLLGGARTLAVSGAAGDGAPRAKVFDVTSGATLADFGPNGPSDRFGGSVVSVPSSSSSSHGSAVGGLCFCPVRLSRPRGVVALVVVPFLGTGEPCMPGPGRGGAPSLAAVCVLVRERGPWEALGLSPASSVRRASDVPKGGPTAAAAAAAMRAGDAGSPAAGSGKRARDEGEAGDWGEAAVVVCGPAEEQGAEAGAEAAGMLGVARAARQSRSDVARRSDALRARLGAARRTSLAAAGRLRQARDAASSPLVVLGRGAGSAGSRAGEGAPACVSRGAAWVVADGGAARGAAWRRAGAAVDGSAVAPSLALVPSEGAGRRGEPWSLSVGPTARAAASGSGGGAPLRVSLRLERRREDGDAAAPVPATRAAAAAILGPEAPCLAAGAEGGAAELRFWSAEEAVGTVASLLGASPPEWCWRRQGGGGDRWGSAAGRLRAACATWADALGAGRAAAEVARLLGTTGPETAAVAGLLWAADAAEEAAASGPAVGAESAAEPVGTLVRRLRAAAAEPRPARTDEVAAAATALSSSARPSPTQPPPDRGLAASALGKVVRSAHVDGVPEALSALSAALPPGEACVVAAGLAAAGLDEAVFAV